MSLTIVTVFPVFFANFIISLVNLSVTVSQIYLCAAEYMKRNPSPNQPK